MIVDSVGLKRKLLNTWFVNVTQSHTSRTNLFGTSIIKASSADEALEAGEDGERK